MVAIARPPAHLVAGFDRWWVCRFGIAKANRNGTDTSARKRIPRRRTVAKAVELPTAYPASPIRRLAHPVQTRIDPSASEGRSMMQKTMQYLCPRKGIGSIHDASVTPPCPVQAWLGDAQGTPWNGIVDMQA
jgi:hypothetical protein